MARRCHIGWTTIVVVFALGIGAAAAYPGAPWFAPGRVYEQNFPDPHVLYDPGSGFFYAYATNTGGSVLPTMWSADGVTWVADEDRFTPPGWAARVGGEAELWAPAIHRLPNGSWRAYYALRETSGSSQHRYCVSVAQGAGPLGPWVDRSTEPLTCGYGSAGAIDPWLHVDDRGDPWLVWKVENHSTVRIADDDVHFPLMPAEIEENEALVEDGGEAPTRHLAAARDAIWSQRLDTDGLAFAQPDDDDEPRNHASILLTASSSGWEERIVENPAMFVAGGRLHLLYSGGRWQSHEYATGWATCSTPAGPCSRATSAPLLSFGGDVNGPGGASVFVDRVGDLRIAYHAWNAPYVDYPSYPGCDDNGDRICADEGQRFLHVDLLCLLPTGALHVDTPVGWRFCDVDPTRWYGTSVAWLADGEITTGVSEGRFAPGTGLTRAQAVTMIWRWAGEPSVSDPHGFRDVDDGRFYTAAVRWAAATGVTRGTTAATFEPDAPVDRGQLATMLHRAGGLPSPSGGVPFGDVPIDAYYADAVAWAASVGVTTGFSPTEYRPDELATRAQFATMLCRFDAVQHSHTNAC
ncbi:MAG: S-layer homology domain-containing protein [Actinomycetota bacterium]